MKTFWGRMMLLSMAFPLSILFLRGEEVGGGSDAKAVIKPLKRGELMEIKKGPWVLIPNSIVRGSLQGQIQSGSVRKIARENEEKEKIRNQSFGKGRVSRKFRSLNLDPELISKCGWEPFKLDRAAFDRIRQQMEKSLMHDFLDLKRWRYWKNKGLSPQEVSRKLGMGERWILFRINTKKAKIEAMKRGSYLSFKVNRSFNLKKDIRNLHERSRGRLDKFFDQEGFRFVLQKIGEDDVATGYLGIFYPKGYGWLNRFYLKDGGFDRAFVYGK